MNILAQQFEDSPIDQAITWLCVAPVQLAIAAGWEVGKLAVSAARLTATVLAWLLSAIAENWKPLAKLAAIVVATLFVCTQPQITIAAIIIAAFAKSTKP
jgi:C4-dicarboxylate transporter